jgi:hypothetical protein
MALPTPVITHSSINTLTLGETPRIIRRGDGFDEGQFEFHLGSEGSLLPGTSVPGYSGLYVTEDSITDHSGDLEHSVRAVGLRSGSQRKIATTATDSEDGFDTGSETWIAGAFGSPFAYGRSHQEFGGLYCVAITGKNSPVAAYKLYDLQFKGIKSTARPARYKFSTATSTVTLENFVNGFSGGDSRNPHRWSIMKGEATMEKSFLSNAPPDYTRVGVQLSGVPNFPATTQLNYSYTSDALTWQWPNGVVLAAINAEQVPGRNAYFITETFIRRDKITA